MMRFAADLRDRHGIAIDIATPHNRGRLVDVPLVRAVKNVLRPLYGALLSSCQRARVQSRLDAYAGNAREPFYRRLLENKDLDDFVNDYYRDDFPIHQSARLQGLTGLRAALPFAAVAD